MNRQIRQLAVGLMACYVVLFVALNYWQVGRQEELNARFDNTRAIRREFEQPRGPIVTDRRRRRRPVGARTRPGSEFAYQRQYPTGDLFAHVTGYYTFAFGSTGLERTQNDVLTGSTAEQQLRDLPEHHHRRPTPRARCRWRCAATSSRSPRTPSASARARSS